MVMAGQSHVYSTPKFWQLMLKDPLLTWVIFTAMKSFIYMHACLHASTGYKIHITDNILFGRVDASAVYMHVKEKLSFWSEQHSILYKLSQGSLKRSANPRIQTFPHPDMIFPSFSATVIQQLILIDIWGVPNVANNNNNNLQMKRINSHAI